ncbi:MAG: lipid-A-disaccharide synthase [Pseudomonadota bacterium]
MAKPERNLHIGVVAGEQSGQLLAADILHQLSKVQDADIRVTGVGGGSLSEFGIDSFFDPEDIALMGITQVVGRLPTLLQRLKVTVERFAADLPDVLLLVDSPDFSSRVASRLKKRHPDLPIAKYVAPTVWAWRPERAAKMVGTIDHVFALFPFEPEIMAELGGPATTYVGHRLMDDHDLMGIWDKRYKRHSPVGKRLNLLFLPGSRASEIRALLPDMRLTAEELYRRGVSFRAIIPAVERYAKTIRDAVFEWHRDIDVSVVVGRDAQLEAFESADAAMAASGTVTLELALAGVPAISIYRMDMLMKPFASMLTGWSAALPNIIADRVVIPEYYDRQIIPGLMARQLEEIADHSTDKYRAIMNGYDVVRKSMKLSRPASESVVEVLLQMLAGQNEKAR